MPFRKPVPVIVPQHEIANFLATPSPTHAPPPNARPPASNPPKPPKPSKPTPRVSPRPTPTPHQPVAATTMRPLRKNKRLRPPLSPSLPPAKTARPATAASPALARRVNKPRASTPLTLRRRSAEQLEDGDVHEKEHDASIASDNTASTASPSSSLLASNDDIGTEALRKIVPVAHQENIFWTKIKGHPNWPAQQVRMSPELEADERFAHAAKFRRRGDDICVMYFGTCEVAFVNKAKACTSWASGLDKNMHLSLKNRAVFQRSLVEVKAYCHKNTRYPRGWWCEPQCFVLASQFYDQCIAGGPLHVHLREFIERADKELIRWAKIKGFPHWPVQVLPRNLAADRYPQLKLSRQSMSSSLPCMFFGTGEVAMIPEKNFLPFGAGITRGYVTASERQDFTVAIGELWGYLQEPRVWPSGYLSGDLWWNYEESKDSARENSEASFDYVPHLPEYEHIRKSVFHEEVDAPTKPRWTNNLFCECIPVEGSKTCVDASCLNVASRVLCSAANCRHAGAGPQCANICFHKRKHPRMKPFFTADQRGWGLKTEQPIKAGEFVIEYVGEIINRGILENRLQDANKQRSHEYYMMDLTNDLAVDAKYKGNLSRFINSSCEPNCATQKWTDAVTGQTHVGIFAMQDIDVGTELTYNYCFEDYGLLGKSQKRSFMCQCGTSSCLMLEEEEKALMKRLIGKRLEVRWDDGWYPGVVETYNLNKKRFRVQYDDGDCEDLVLGLSSEEDDGVAFRLVDEEKQEKKKEEMRKREERKNNSDKNSRSSSEGKGDKRKEERRKENGEEISGKAKMETTKSKKRDSSGSRRRENSSGSSGRSRSRSRKEDKQAKEKAKISKQKKVEAQKKSDAKAAAATKASSMDVDAEIKELLENAGPDTGNELTDEMKE